MSSISEVVVEGGGLYSIKGYGGKYTVCRVRVGFLSNDRIVIGTAGSLDAALALIKVNSGRRIKSIT